MAVRKNLSTLSASQRTQLRTFLDQYITKPVDNPVQEHLNAGNNMTLHIHGHGFLAWHYYFLAKLENWLVLNGGESFIPLPYWNPAQPIPAQLSKNNTNVNMPLPQNLRPPLLRQVPNYPALNDLMVPYHSNVHNAAGGQMPDPQTSPSDPIFWPFHSFLVGAYERWRNY